MSDKYHECTGDRLKAQFKANLASGLVPLFTYWDGRRCLEWRRREECINTGKHWERKVEVAIFKVGAAQLMKAFRRFGTTMSEILATLDEPKEQDNYRHLIDVIVNDRQTEEEDDK